ncbi:Uncharacterised protein [Vibrio cholerae]|nr:Uncharacterised protein [Vibrio cholerae]
MIGVTPSTSHELPSRATICSSPSASTQVPMTALCKSLNVTTPTTSAYSFITTAKSTRLILKYSNASERLNVSGIIGQPMTTLLSLRFIP